MKYISFCEDTVWALLPDKLELVFERFGLKLNAFVKGTGLEF